MKGNANTKIRKCRKHRATQCLTIKKKIETNEPPIGRPLRQVNKNADRKLKLS